MKALGEQRASRRKQSGRISEVRDGRGRQLSINRQDGEYATETRRRKYLFIARCKLNSGLIGWDKVWYRSGLCLHHLTHEAGAQVRPSTLLHAKKPP